MTGCSLGEPWSAIVGLVLFCAGAFLMYWLWSDSDAVEDRDGES
jgi:hypothetical protein